MLGFRLTRPDKIADWHVCTRKDTAHPCDQFESGCGAHLRNRQSQGCAGEQVAVLGNGAAHRLGEDEWAVAAGKSECRVGARLSRGQRRGWGVLG